MTGELTINGWDAYSRWGISPSDGAFVALRTPPEKKERVKNVSRLQHGSRYVGDVERYDERQITLPLHIVASSAEDLCKKFDKFATEVLDGGRLEIVHHIAPDVRYKCLYIGCANYVESCGIAKFQLKLVEPNPTDRS